MGYRLHPIRQQMLPYCFSFPLSPFSSFPLFILSFLFFPTLSIFSLYLFLQIYCTVTIKKRYKPPLNYLIININISSACIFYWRSACIESPKKDTSQHSQCVEKVGLYLIIGVEVLRCLEVYELSWAQRSNPSADRR